MSRVGRRPIVIPDGVSVEQAAGLVRVKGPKGTLSERLPAGITVTIEGGQVSLARPDDRKQTRALHGLSRALLANMVLGVTTPFVKELEIQGVGYRADVSGNKVKLLVGFSHPVEVAIPDGLKVSVDRNVMVRIEGADRQQVGQFAANLRGIRPPEPYKGKGIRYVGERVRRKVGKSGATAAGG
jgi:large subunit ribosomal protein L6